MKSLWFRTKPRSIIKTIEWFSFFAQLEGQNWNQKLENTVSSFQNKPIYPVRRKYIFLAHNEELKEKLGINSYEDYISGLYDINETESAGRNDKTTYEFFGFGYVDNNGIIRTTKVGKLIQKNEINDEIFLKQLLKIHFPSPAIHKKPDGENVFLMEIILNVFKYFNDLNKFEIGFIFGCSDIKYISKTIDAIKDFKKEYKKVTNKLDINNIMQLFDKIFKNYYPSITNKTETYYKDYSDSLVRALQYTGIFSQRGRGLYSRIYVPEHSKVKLKLLQDKYTFNFNNEQDFDKYMQWFGDPDNLILPWEKEDNRKIIINKKIKLLQKKLNNVKGKINNLDVNIKLQETDNLIELERTVTNYILSFNEKLFIEYESKTKKVRKEIIEKFIDILEGNEDMAALWLELNTWKSLVAINGEQNVKRNFKIEEDLIPKSFAPGIGNTADMELYKNGYIIIPEVSLMTGVRQWEHEGSSVIEHVFEFIKKYENKEVYGLFISSQINIRTLWQFFILNRESWIGKPVPVVPLTIRQYVDIISFIYANNLYIDDFKQLIENIHNKTFEYSNFKQWEDNINIIIEKWKEKYK